MQSFSWHQLESELSQLWSRRQGDGVAGCITLTRRVIQFSTSDWLRSQISPASLQNSQLFTMHVWGLAILSFRIVQIFWTTFFKICPEYQQIIASIHISHWQPNSVYLFTNQRMGMSITLTRPQSTMALRDTFVDLGWVSVFHMTSCKILNSRYWKLKRYYRFNVKLQSDWNIVI